MDPTSTRGPSHTYGTVHAEGEANLVLGDVHNIHNVYYASEDGPKERKPDVMQLLKYENMTTKREFSMPKGSYAHDWIWKTLFPGWLSNLSDDPFWICGKPGSGKSTLVAYLVHHNKTSKLLEASGAEFQIIHFFYDYRAGKSLANSIQGMLRMFLYQLADQNKGIRERLQYLLEQERLVLNSTDELQELTREALKLSKSRFCIFIDGLDEYEGNPRRLIQTCRQITEQSGVKLCLASRPEFQVSQVFTLYGEILMQDYNKESMRQYATEEVLQVKVTQLDIETRCTVESIDNLIEKAEGIILWFKLAFDEFLRKCVEGQSMDYLRKFVTEMPIGMDALYTRILSIIPASHRPQAALILYLVQKLREFDNEATMVSTTDLDHLSEAYDFVVSRVGDSLGLTKLKDYQDMRSRIDFSLRGLLDFHSYGIDDDEMWPSSTNMDIRYVHKTFNSYIQKANWIEEHLPSQVEQLYPDSFWLRFATNILEEATMDHVLTYNELQECLLEMNFLVEADENDMEWKHVGKLIRRLVSRRRSYLIALATELCPPLIDKLFDEIDSEGEHSKFEKAAKTASSWILSLNKPLTFPSTWKSRYAVLRTAMFTFADLAQDVERAGTSTFPYLTEALRSHFSIAMCFEFFMETATPRWVIETLFGDDSVRDIVTAIICGLKLYVADRLAADPLSESQQELLIRCFIALLTYRGDEIDGKFFAKLFAKHNYQLSNQNSCFFLLHTGCCMEAAEQARILGRLSKSTKFTGHMSDCPYRPHGFGQLIHWVQHSCPTKDDYCSEDDYESAYHSILTTFFREEDVNAYCYVGGTALQALLDHSVRSLPDRSHICRKAKFIVLIHKGLNPQTPSPRGKGLETAIQYYQAPAWKRGIVNTYFKRDYDESEDIGLIIAYLRRYEAQSTWPQLEELKELEFSSSDDDDDLGEKD